MALSKTKMYPTHPIWTQKILILEMGVQQLASRKLKLVSQTNSV